MFHPFEVKDIKDKLEKETALLHKHIEVLKDQLEERENTIKQLREELGRSGKTTWVEDNG